MLAVVLAAVLSVAAAAACTSGSSQTGGPIPTTPVTAPAETASTEAPTTAGTLPTTAAPTPTRAATPVPQAPTATCHLRGLLPDPVCTPGAINPAVTPANIATTICKTGWTATVRPPEAYTEALKRQQMAAYGFTGSLSDFEEDHLIPLELGGHPSDPRNLWPQPGASPNPKDAVELAAHDAVCAGRLPLATAQQEMARDWTALGRQLGVA